VHASLKVFGGALRSASMESTVAVLIMDYRCLFSIVDGLFAALSSCSFLMDLRLLNVVTEQFEGFFAAGMSPE
jgi:hypothetical protein